MAVSITIQNYLDKLGVNYTLLTHDHTESSIKTAAASRVQGSRLVKAVIISDDDGYMMVILFVI